MTFHCFLNTSVCRSISLGLPCLLWRASFTPEPWQQVSCHSRGGLALTYLWFFSVVIVWVLTAVARYCDPSPNKRPDVLLSVVTWRGETECIGVHTSSLQTPNSSPCIKDRFYWSSSISVRWFFLKIFFAFPLFIFFKSLHGKVCLPSLLSAPSLSTQYQISFPSPCHLCTTFIMTDWWLPLQHLYIM